MNKIRAEDVGVQKTGGGAANKDQISNRHPAEVFEQDIRALKAPRAQIINNLAIN